MPGDDLPEFILFSINMQMAGGQHVLSSQWTEEQNSNSGLSRLLPNLRNYIAGQRWTPARDRSCECFADTGLEEMSK